MELPFVFLKICVFFYSQNHFKFDFLIMLCLYSHRHNLWCAISWQIVTAELENEEKHTTVATIFWFREKFNFYYLSIAAIQRGEPDTLIAGCPFLKKRVMQSVACSFIPTVPTVSWFASLSFFMTNEQNQINQQKKTECKANVDQPAIT